LGSKKKWFDNRERGTGVVPPRPSFHQKKGECQLGRGKVLTTKEKGAGQVGGGGGKSVYQGGHPGGGERGNGVEKRKIFSGGGIRKGGASSGWEKGKKGLTSFF